MRVSTVGPAWLALQSACAAAEQIPIHNPAKTPPSSKWNLNFSSEAPHYFASVYGLLQQWPQTYFPNGFSIVPCEIPPFTKLYHGRHDEYLPPSPEWFAFDIAMSYGIMGGTRNSHMLTYQNTRPVKCVYFDGESASLSGTGQMDTQMLHIWGNISGPAGQDSQRFMFDEYARAKGLCTWLKEKVFGGPGWGYEGIVRMNTAFEMIWCDFTSPSIRLISHLNVSAPLPPNSKSLEGSFDNGNPTPASPMPTTLFPLPTTPSLGSTDLPNRPSDPFTPDRESFRVSRVYEWFLSATNHYGSIHSPGLGEYRIKLDTCGFLSYYDPIFQSQALARAQKERKSLNLTDSGIWMGPRDNGTRIESLKLLSRRRRLHTLEELSSSDAAVMRMRSERVVNASLTSTGNCSGINWFILTNDIVQTHAQPILKLARTLEMFESVAENKTSFEEWAVEIREQSHSFLLPFYEYPDLVPNKDSKTEQNSAEAYSRCRFQHTRMLYPDQGLNLGPEESLLRWAVEETQGTICLVLVEIGVAIEDFWETTFNPPRKSLVSHPTLQTAKKEVHRWKSGIEELMAWLGWVSEYTGCDRKCAWDETCYIPMWPVIPMRFDRPRFNGTFPPYGFPRNGTRYPFPSGFNPWIGSEVDLWEPKCTKKSFFVNGKRP